MLRFSWLHVVIKRLGLAKYLGEICLEVCDLHETSLAFHDVMRFDI